MQEIAFWQIQERSLGCSSLNALETLWWGRGLWDACGSVGLPAQELIFGSTIRFHQKTGLGKWRLVAQLHSRPAWRSFLSRDGTRGCLASLDTKSFVFNELLRCWIITLCTWGSPTSWKLMPGRAEAPDRWWSGKAPRGRPGSRDGPRVYGFGCSGLAPQAKW